MLCINCFLAEMFIYLQVCEREVMISIDSWARSHRDDWMARFYTQTDYDLIDQQMSLQYDGRTPVANLKPIRNKQILRKWFPKELSLRSLKSFSCLIFTAMVRRVLESDHFDVHLQFFCFRRASILKDQSNYLRLSLDSSFNLKTSFPWQALPTEHSLSPRTTSVLHFRVHGQTEWPLWAFPLHQV